jgi:protein-S-isoprenylcysteine O-methyltransferase Ste14
MATVAHWREAWYAHFTTIVRQALVLGQLVLLLYAAAFCVAAATFAHWYEEPILARRFGAQYEAYRQAAPAWWPCRHPWESGEVDEF